MATRRFLKCAQTSASWPKAQQVCRWSKAHTREVKRAGGVYMLALRLLIMRPWLNPREPHGVHATRAGVEAELPLTVPELITRGGAYSRCAHDKHLKQHVL